jgi:hypothetical protein
MLDFVIRFFKNGPVSGNLLPEEVEFIPRDRMDMIARYLERRAKTAPP